MKSQFLVTCLLACLPLYPCQAKAPNIGLKEKLPMNHPGRRVVDR